MGGYSPISSYAMIGDCRSAALIGKNGSIDWLCLPRFDSPSIFAALLDPEVGGRFQIRPTGSFTSEHRYLPHTNILETTFRTTHGTCVLRDLLPVASESEKRQGLEADHEVLREIEGTSGEIELEIVYDPRPDYGLMPPQLEERGDLGFWAQTRRATLVLQSEVPLALVDGRRGARGVGSIRAGQRKYLSFTYTQEAPAVIPPLGQSAGRRVERSIRWWEAWSERCTYQGPYREAVLRSALALKLMAYAPSGAIVAAPTTSLPEQIGGERNWDYRYCWLRDASFTLRALLRLGYHEEADAFESWILHATRLSWPELQVLYDVFGEVQLRERELTHLAGYRHSSPVRVGNAAHGQLQLDAYGEVIDAAARFARYRGAFDRDTTHLLQGLGHTVCRRWREPDEGIWEIRAGRQHHTHSKVLCWVALDRLLTMHKQGHLRLTTSALDRFQEERGALRTEIEVHGYNEQLQTYTRTFDGDDLDASLLTLPLYGYISGTHPRMRATCQRVRGHLGRGALVSRYSSATDDGLAPGEGAFGICSFWAVECLARGDEIAAATQAFEELLTYANEVGLYAEQIDLATGAALGNFPQAFTHIGLIDAALTLGERLTSEASPRQTAGVVSEDRA